MVRGLAVLCALLATVSAALAFAQDTNKVTQYSIQHQEMMK